LLDLILNIFIIISDFHDYNKIISNFLNHIDEMINRSPSIQIIFKNKILFLKQYHFGKLGNHER